MITFVTRAGRGRDPLLALLALLGVAAVALTTIAQTHAQAPRGKPITIVVPYTPGSGADTISRAIAEPLQAKLGRPVIVESRIGAGGNIGTASVARAPADGTTLLMTANTITINKGLFKNPGYDPLTSFTPVMQIAKGRMVLAANPAFPASTVQEFIAYAKSKPGGIDYASPGRGTPHHLAMELLQHAAGIRLVHVPYAGLAKSMTDLVANHVGTMFVGIHSIKPFVDEGKVKILGLASLQRAPSLPNVPTIAEQGLSGFEVESWFGLLAPANTPPDVVQAFHAAVSEVLSRPDILMVLENQGLEFVGGPSERLQKLMEADLAKWLKLIKDAQIAPE